VVRKSRASGRPSAASSDGGVARGHTGSDLAFLVFDFAPACASAKSPLERFVAEAREVAPQAGASRRVICFEFKRDAARIGVPHPTTPAASGRT
jgi:hypothetical protein